MPPRDFEEGFHDGASPLGLKKTVDSSNFYARIDLAKLCKQMG